MDKIKHNSKALYAVVFIVSVLPLFCGYLLNTGKIMVWVNGVQEWQSTTAEIGIKAYYAIPAFLYKVTDSIVFAYIVQIMLIQGIALLGTYMMFRAFSQNQWGVLLGVTLYMLSPYRIDLCYVQAEVVLSAVWAFVPWYLYGLMMVKEKGSKKIGYLVLSAVVLAIIGYGSGVMFFIMAAFTLLVAVVFRSVAALVLLAGGTLLWLPGNLWFLKYLFTDGTQEGTFIIKNITLEGYSLVDFMTSFTYMNGKPGLGLGFLFAVAIFLYVRFVNGGAKLSKESKLFGTVGVLSLFMATRYFPWELVQRVGTWALKFVSLIDTPALFAGAATLVLPVVLISAVGDLEEAEEKIAARGSLVLTWLAAVGVAVYICNMLTYRTTAL